MENFVVYLHIYVQLGLAALMNLRTQVTLGQSVLTDYLNERPRMTDRTCFKQTNARLKRSGSKKPGIRGDRIHGNRECNTLKVREVPWKNTTEKIRAGPKSVPVVLVSR